MPGKRYKGKRRFKKRFGRRKKGKSSDMGLIRRGIKTYPFLITGEQDVTSTGVSGTAQNFSLLINYPGYWCNNAGTIGPMTTYSGMTGLFFRQASGITIFDEYRVVKVLVKWFPQVVNYDEANGFASAAPVYTATYIDRDSVYTIQPPNANHVLNYGSIQYHPAVQRTIVREAKNEGTLERGYYNCQYENPNQLPVATGNIIPVAKRSSIGYFMPAFNAPGGSFMGRLVCQWYVRFRGVAGQTNVNYNA